MTCFHPVEMYYWYDHEGNRVCSHSQKDASRHIHFKMNRPCGQCIGCQLDRSLEVAVRATHEAKCYDHNCFITLTVDPEHLNEVFPHGSLNKRSFQLFAKRLRKEFHGLTFVPCPGFRTGKSWNYTPIRFLWCGEYGDHGLRPHYHACVFNFDFEDKYPFQIRHGVTYYRSPTLERLWPYGFSTIGELNFQTAAYLARYVTKKIKITDSMWNAFMSGELSDNSAVLNDIDKYTDPITGEIDGKMKEFIEFPRGYGLGRLYYEKFKSDFYHPDRKESGVHIDRKGKVVTIRTPKYYDSIYKTSNPKELDLIKRGRVERARAHSSDNTPDRLAAREEVQLARFGKLKRSLEND